VYHVLYVPKLCGLLFEPFNKVQRHHIVHIEKRFLVLQKSFVLLLNIPRPTSRISFTGSQTAPGYRLQNRYSDPQCSVFWPSGIPSL